MAFFKFRKTADESASAPPAAESIEAMRQRAKYRLVGASVLVLLGVIGLPLLFDKQPRPIAVDTPIDIPERNKVSPLTLPASPAPKAEVPDAVKAPQVAASARETAMITETAQPVKSDKKFESKVPSVPVSKASSAIKNEAHEASKPTKPAAVATVAQAADAAKAQAALDGKTVDASTAVEGRIVVQVGAFADAARAHEVRLKLERAGLKTYTHVAETKDGKRIRVRVGPFSAKSEAEKAAAKIKKLDLPAALLTL